MKLRNGRLNSTQFIDENTIRKIGVVPETSRPTRLKIEVWALKEARKRGLNVPEVYDYYIDSDGQEVMIRQYVPGHTLTRSVSLSNSECFQDIGAQMLLLGRTAKKYGWIDPELLEGKDESWELFLRAYTLKYGQRLVDAEIIQDRHLQLLGDAFVKTDLNIGGSYLLHRDIKPTNIIQDLKGDLWILDWENVMFGDPLYDLAIFGNRYGEGVLWNNLVKGYNLQAPLPDRYTLYRAIVFIGVLDFHRKQNLGYAGRRQQFLNLLSRHSLFRA